MPIPRLVLIDLHTFFRAGFRALIDARHEYEVVGEAATARSGLQVTADQSPDIVITDIRFAGAGGLSLLRDLRRRGSTVPLLFLTGQVTDDVVREAFGALANGFALKSQTEAEVFASIDDVLKGRRYVAPSLVDAMAVGVLPKDGLLALLTAREREIFDLLLRGFPNGHIGKELFISVKTVETHRTRVMKKLGVHTIADLLRFAARRSLLDPVIGQVDGRLPAVGQDVG